MNKLFTSICVDAEHDVDRPFVILGGEFVIAERYVETVDEEEGVEGFELTFLPRMQSLAKVFNRHVDILVGDLHAHEFLHDPGGGAQVVALSDKGQELLLETSHVLHALGEDSGSERSFAVPGTINFNGSTGGVHFSRIRAVSIVARTFPPPIPLGTSEGASEAISGVSFD